MLCQVSSNATPETLTDQTAFPKSQQEKLQQNKTFRYILTLITPSLSASLLTYFADKI